MHGNQQDLGRILIVTIAAVMLSSSRTDCQEASPQALYDQAGKALDAGNTAQAIKLYEELLRRFPIRSKPAPIWVSLSRRKDDTTKLCGNIARCSHVILRTRPRS